MNPPQVYMCSPELPVQVRCTILDAWGWGTGTTQRDGMGREEGGGFRRRILRAPLDCKEIKAVNSKGNQSWIFIGRTDAEAETPILWPPAAKKWLIGKDPDVGKDWKREEKGTTKDEMVGWHHQLDGHEFEQALGDSKGQGKLVCCSPWGCKESDTA